MSSRNLNPSRKINNKTKKKRAQGNRQLARVSTDTQTPMRNDFPMVPHMLQPMSYVAPFAFDLPSELFNNPGGSIVSEIMQSNDPYDWLLAILTNAMQFLNYMFQRYGKCKVLDFDVQIFFDNLEQVVMDLFFFSSLDAQTGISASKNALVAAAATGIYRGGFSLSEQYGKNSSREWRDKIKPMHVTGNILKFKASDDFSVTQSSGPPKVTYYGWYAAIPLNAMNSGLSRRIRISSRLYFYEPLTITSNLTKVNPVNPRSWRGSGSNN